MTDSINTDLVWKTEGKVAKLSTVVAFTSHSTCYLQVEKITQGIEGRRGHVFFVLHTVVADV